MMELNVVSEEELNACPNCTESLAHGATEFLGEGVMVARVYCNNCDWFATEEWVHDQTVREE